MSVKDHSVWSVGFALAYAGLLLLIQQIVVLSELDLQIEAIEATQLRQAEEAKKAGDLLRSFRSELEEFSNAITPIASGETEKQFYTCVRDYSENLKQDLRHLLRGGC
jgi:hypothetical protein